MKGPARMLIGAVVTCALAAPATAAAATYTISSTSDGNGSCTGLVCPSLRAAVTSVPAGSTIQLGAGTYTLSLGHLPITQSVTIAGAGSAQTTIKQTQAGPDILFITGGDVTLSNLTLTGGRTAGDSGNNEVAGAIDDSAATGSLTLSGDAITGNTATGFSAPAGASPASGGYAVGALLISSGSTSLTINNSSITGNSATGGHGGDQSGSGNGAAGGTAYGAIWDLGGPITINNSTISGNTGTGGTGGEGANNAGFSGGISGQTVGALAIIEHSPSYTTTISESTISGNHAIGGTGGFGTANAKGGKGNSVFGTLSFSVGNLVIRASTISGNSAKASTGGDSVSFPPSPGGDGGSDAGAGVTIASGNATIINSTISGNSALASDGGTGVPDGSAGFASGGGISDSAGGGPLTLVSDTIAGNSAPEGGNLDVSNQPLTIAQTIISGGSAPFASNCHFDTVTVTDDGHNLDDSTPSQCGLSAAKQDIIGKNPLLGPLAANGGPTMAEVLNAGSPALNAGGTCTQTADQRAFPRHNPCDIGAVEDQAPVNSSAPQITGTFALGKALTCSPGSWTGDGLSFSYQWQRDGVPISGATQASYTITPEDYGPVLACVVTANNPAGSTSAKQYASARSGCPCPPTLSHAAQSHSTWRMGSALAKVSARRKASKRPPVGTTFTFTLNMPANVSLAFQKLVRGRLAANGRCQFQNKRNAHRRRCLIVIGAGTLQFTGHAGTNKVVFDGRVSRTYKLQPGNYQVAISAQRPVLGFPRSSVSTLRFTIVR